MAYFRVFLAINKKTNRVGLCTTGWQITNDIYPSCDFVNSKQVDSHVIANNAVSYLSKWCRLQKH